MGRSNRLYIGHISSRIREKDIDYEFGRYGRIRDLSLKQGFAFLEYEKAEDAEYAIRKMDGVNLEGLRITVEFAKELPVRQPQKGGSGYRLVCENLSPYTSWQDLKDFARKAGKVTYTDVYSERGEKMGIIEYATKEDMEEALYSLDGRELHRYRCKLYKGKGVVIAGG